MADLAGFDVIGEVHLETVADIINLMPLQRPIDGTSIYLLGGAFSIDLSADFGPLGKAAIRMILDASLVPAIHQPVSNLVISIQGGSTSIAGLSLEQIAASVTVSVPMGFTAGPPTPGAPPNQQVPAFLFSATSPEVAIDDHTRNLANGILGPGGAGRLESALRGALEDFLSSIGTQAIPVLGFTVIPGQDSKGPTQLSALPTVAWIDGTTLGVFGYYSAAASGGNVNVKATGDLKQDHEEFFYNQPGVIPVLPGRRAAVLMSADAFKEVLGCSVIRNSIIRNLVEMRDQGIWRSRIQSRDGAAVLSQQTEAHFLQYLVDEFSKDKFQNSDTVTQDIQRAKNRVQEDADSVIDNRAAAEEEAWLDSPDGQQAITEAVPQPCGSGAAQIFRQDLGVPGEQSPLVGMLTAFSMTLGSDHIVIHYQAHASLEDVVGDVAADVVGDVEVGFLVSDLGSVSTEANVHLPIITPLATGLSGAFLAFVQAYFSAEWASIMTFLSLLLQDHLQGMIAGQLGQLPITFPQKPFPTRMVDIKIDQESMTVLGLVCRHALRNEFSPGLIVDATSSRTQSDQPPVNGKLNLHATDWGCPAVVFNTTRTFWDTTISVRGRLRDAPLPVTVLGWVIELGNFTTSMVGSTHIVDPRPTWSNSPSTLSAGHLTLTGNVNHPDPPIVLITPGGVLGHLQSRNDVSVAVTGDPDSGWQLHFLGTEGNFYVRVGLDVRDGVGTEWHGETFIAVQGDQLQLPPEYTQYKADCDAKYAQWFELKLLSMGRLVALGKVQPGAPVMNGETREAIAIRTLVAVGNPSAMRQLTAANERFGKSVLQQVGRVQPLTVTPSEGGQLL